MFVCVYRFDWNYGWLGIGLVKGGGEKQRGQYARKKVDI